jgi:hypothetical protein
MQRAITKFLIAFLLLSLNAFAAQEDFIDCTPEDKCTYADCESRAVKTEGGMSISSCRKVFKKGEFAFYEVFIKSTRPANPDGSGNENITTAVRLK